jgi:hypothetical protein
MAAGKKKTELGSVTEIVEALIDHDAPAQDRILASALALLGRALPVGDGERKQDRREPARDERREHRDDGGGPKPKGLTELLAEKKPGTNPQRIVLFAYYRDKYEDNARFGRADLEPYFAQAHLGKPGNYDRDFTTSVERGWIHESGDQSYITTSGIEVVEKEFDGERVYAQGGKKKTARKGGAKKRAGAKK